MKEIWKHVVIDRSYMVSSTGRVKSLERDIYFGIGYCAKRTNPERILTPWSSNGYHQVNLSGRKRVHVHRLVAEAFLEKVEGRDHVNHKDGNRSNNNVENLEWVTPSENILHAYRELGRIGSCIGRFGEHHPTSKPVISTDMKTGVEVSYECGLEAVIEGFDSGCISRCCSGENAYHKGRYWSYA